MDLEGFKKLIKDYNEDNITSDEPHVSIRCEENNIKLDYLKRIILDENSNLIRIVKDRQKVYKLYCRLSRKKELKIVIDLLDHKNINIRTVKILTNKFRIKYLRKQRF